MYLYLRAELVIFLNEWFNTQRENIIKQNDLIILKVESLSHHAGN